MAQRYAEGQYDSILNDPAKKAEFIMYHHFGEQAAKNIRNKALEEAQGESYQTSYTGKMLYEYASS